MSSGWRAQFGGRGRERAWWLLAAAVLFAVLGAVAQALKWSGWAMAVLGGLAVAAALGGPGMRGRVQVDETPAGVVEGGGDGAQRPGPVAPGREGAVAQALKWSGWAMAVLGGLAVAAALVVPELRARFKQDDTRAALVERAVTVPEGPARLPLVREAGLAQLRVHTAQVQVPYVQRDAEQTVAETLGPGRAVLLVGHSMAGKTRLKIFN